MAYNLLLNGIYWGYNPFTNHFLTSWDIQVRFLLLVGLRPAWNPKLPSEAIGARRVSGDDHSVLDNRHQFWYSARERKSQILSVGKIADIRKKSGMLWWHYQMRCCWHTMAHMYSQTPQADCHYLNILVQVVWKYARLSTQSCSCLSETKAQWLFLVPLKGGR